MKSFFDFDSCMKLYESKRIFFVLDQGGPDGAQESGSKSSKFTERKRRFRLTKQLRCLRTRQELKSSSEECSTGSKAATSAGKA